MKDDLISRQAAIDALDAKITVTGRENAEAVRRYVTLIVDRIVNLPPAQPEPCEDAVSRFEVLRLIDYSSNDLNDSVDNRYFQGKVKELPSVTPKQPGWIPTSEKLPEEDTPVLICSTEEDKFYHSVAVGWYCGGEWHCWDDRYGKGDVNAWMPLPTPYREGGQDEQN